MKSGVCVLCTGNIFVGGRVEGGGMCEFSEWRREGFWRVSYLWGEQ